MRQRHVHRGFCFDAASSFTCHDIVLFKVQVVVDELRDQISKSLAFSISIDESAAIDNTEYLSTELQFCNEKGQRHNAFLALRKLEHMHASALVECVVRLTFV
jgi:hypothetical protein